MKRKPTMAVQMISIEIDAGISLLGMFSGTSFIYLLAWIIGAFRKDSKF